jgi:hypothetical protein
MCLQLRPVTLLPLLLLRPAPSSCLLLLQPADGTRGGLTSTVGWSGRLICSACLQRWKTISVRIVFWFQEFPDPIHIPQQAHFYNTSSRP